ncbi:uncharacterized protein DNG_03646 [Cephalotrichum gorgonifer]|uniref:Uncharacterized protein n=1 Tax=Cephalotrichum gorgonifer TaxID=2041049 RepID=A0AAE8STS6_9PEZI|nr:uncharacterized protein DNG_03646 [Cephalotrichum gorgonifer]
MSGHPMTYTGHADTRLLHGCIREAERCGLMSYSLDGLRNALPEHYHAHMIGLSEEIRVSSRILRDLVDRSEAHFSRVPVLLQHLNIILPCLSKTLNDIDGYIEDRSISKEMRWRKMYNKMTDEVGGIALPQQFLLYNQFLDSIFQMLTRLETLKTLIMGLREKRAIPPPAPQVGGALIRPDMIVAPISREPPSHWAQQIFSLPLPSRTALKTPKRSKSCGPHKQLAPGQPPFPPGSMVLFRRFVRRAALTQAEPPFRAATTGLPLAEPCLISFRSFDNDSLSLIVSSVRGTPQQHLSLVTSHQGIQWLAVRGVHELRIQRKHSAVELWRWSESTQTSKLWAALYFITWEEMVLFYCTFSSLKIQNSSTVLVDKDEYTLQGERRLFQAQIIDDNYKHSLIVYQDTQTKGIRLHAAVWEGEMRQCPVWTAFVTHQCTSPTWLVKESRRRVWLRDVQLYVFHQNYRQENQRKGREGAFEIDFLNEKAAARFYDVFYPPTSPTNNADSDKEGGPST